MAAIIAAPSTSETIIAGIVIEPDVPPIEIGAPGTLLITIAAIAPAS